MKPSPNHLYFTLLILLFVGCGGGASSSTNGDNKLEGNTTLSFVHINDLHANIVPHNEQITMEGNNTVLIKKMGGLARLKTKIDTIKNDNTNTIVMNTGDTYHGTAEAMFTNGNMIVDLVNLLGIDIGVIGNWDYAYGPVVTHTRFGNISQSDVHRPNFPVIAANAFCAEPKGITSPLILSLIETRFECNTGDLWLSPTQIIEKNGIKVGFIGLTSDIVDKMHELMGFNLDFTQSEDEYIALLKLYSTQLKASGADMVVVMSELGIHKDYALAKALDANVVNIFFSAHTHELTKEALITSNGTYVVEAGSDAYVGQMDVQFNSAKNITQYSWRIHALDDSISESSELNVSVNVARAPMIVDNPAITIPKVTLDGLPPVAEALLPSYPTLTLNHSLNKTLAHTTLLLDRRDALESQLNNVITDLLRTKYNADIAMTAGFRFDSTLVEHEHTHNTKEYYFNNETDALLGGDILTSDVYRFFPTPYYLGEGNITGENLKKIIEQNLNAVYSTDIFQQSGGWVDGFSGIKLDLNLSQTNNKRILSLRKSTDNSLITNSDVLHTVGCQRPSEPEPTTTLCSYTNFTAVTSILEGGEKYVISEFFIDEILNGHLDTLMNRTNINDVSNTARWIDNNFYQPLEGAQ